MKDLNIPRSSIAKFPATPRGRSRLLVFDKERKSIQDDFFYNLIDHLESKYLLVANNTKVVSAKFAMMIINRQSIGRGQIR